METGKYITFNFAMTCLFFVSLYVFIWFYITDDFFSYRFYYELPNQFTPAQKSAIERVTMSRIICDNTGITQVPRNVFVANSYPRDFVACSRIPVFDLSPWRRKKSGSGRRSGVKNHVCNCQYPLKKKSA